MIYQGNSISVSLLEDGIAKLNYDNQTESVNKFDQTTIKEFGEAVTALEQSSDVKGLIVTSGKKVFIAGADITEFVGNFKKPEGEIASWVFDINKTFNLSLIHI